MNMFNKIKNFNFGKHERDFTYVENMVDDSLKKLQSNFFVE